MPFARSARCYRDARGTHCPGLGARALHAGRLSLWVGFSLATVCVGSEHPTIGQPRCFEWKRLGRSLIQGRTMNYEHVFAQALQALHRERRYRVFADIERIAGRFPRAIYLSAQYRRTSPRDRGLVLQ